MKCLRAAPEKNVLGWWEGRDPGIQGSSWRPEKAKLHGGWNMVGTEARNGAHE